MLALNTLKTPFRESPSITGCHATPLVTLFFGITMLFTGRHAMPCQWWSSDLPRVLRIWESASYSQAFFTIHYFLLVSRLPWGWQFNLKVSRASCWSLKDILGPTICLNHYNPQSRYSGRFYLRLMAGRLRNEESASYRVWTLLMNRWLCQKPYVLSVRPHSHTFSYFNVCVLKVLSWNIG